MYCPSCESVKLIKITDRPIQSYLEMNILPSQFEVMKCSHCGIYFKSELPDELTLKCYYDSISDTFWEHELYPHELRIRDYLSRLPSNKRILDIGCGTALLVSQFVNKHTCFGIEANSKAAALAESKGVKIIDSWIGEKFFSQQKFDVIIMLDVFEHLTQPTHVLKDLYSMLNVGGKLILVTGRTNCIPFKLLGPRLWYIKIAQHLVFLNKTYLKWLNNILPNSQINATPICHYIHKPFPYFSREFISIILLILFSSWSRFKLFVIKRYNKDISYNASYNLFSRSFKDHYFIQIEKLS